MLVGKEYELAQAQHWTFMWFFASLMDMDMEQLAWLQSFFTRHPHQIIKDLLY